MADKKPIVSKHVKVSVQGPYGPEAVGQFTKITHTREVEAKEYLEVGAEVATQIEGTVKFSGTLSKGKIDEKLARIIWGRTKIQRGLDPAAAPRYILTYTKTYYDGTKGIDTYGDVLFTKIEETVDGGAIVEQTFDWTAEKWENEEK